jgi:peptide/nickel transport system permease protein
VTLFGISVITFAITRLAPGDPFSIKEGMLNAQSSQAATEENIRQNRKIYGFDKPVVLNFRFDDKIKNIKSLLKEYLSASNIRRKSIEEEFSDIIQIALPFLIEKLTDKRYVSLSLNLLEKLYIANYDMRKLRKRLIKIYSFWDALKESTEDKIKYWLNFYSSQKNFYTSENAEKETGKYLKGASNIETIKELGALCVPYLMESLERTSAMKDRVIITSALSSVLKRSWVYSSELSAREKSIILYRWSSWWAYNKERFVAYGYLKSFGRIFSNTQYGIWIKKIITFDFDESYTYKRPVLELISERLPVSVQLSVLSIVLTYILAIPIGIFSATSRYSLKDRITTVSLFILYSLPSFWVASMLILFTTGGDFPDIFPARYLHSIGSENFNFAHYMVDWLWHLVLPVFCLTYGSLAYLSRQMRVGMLDVIRQDYIKTARAKGLTEKLVIYKHALKNALIPVVTILSAILPALIGGSIIIEEIFSIDGMGRLAFEAILNRDYPIINAIAFFSAFLTLVGILLSDILYAVIDPRIKFKGSKI